MEGRLLIKNCTVLNDEDPRFHQAVIIEGKTVRAITDDAASPVLPGDWEVAAHGRLLITGRTVPSDTLRLLMKTPRTVPQVQAIARWIFAQQLLSGVVSVRDALSTGAGREVIEQVAAEVGMSVHPPKESTLDVIVGSEANLMLLDLVEPSPTMLPLAWDASVAWVITSGIVRVRERRLVSFNMTDLARAASLALQES